MAGKRWMIYTPFPFKLCPLVCMGTLGETIGHHRSVLLNVFLKLLINNMFHKTILEFPVMIVTIVIALFVTEMHKLPAFCTATQY